MSTKWPLFVCVIGLIGFARSAPGQDAPVQQQAAVLEANLQPVIVTALKVKQNIIDAPVTVTALSAQDLQAANIVDIEGLSAYAPGFTAVGGPSFGRFQRGVTDYVIRGMVPGRTVDPLRQNVTVFMDGVPISGGNVPGLSDVASVEIIEGPQSAYFGRATFAGAINLIMRQPSLQKYSAHVDAKAYSYGSTDDTVDLEGPIVPDVLSVRVSGRYYHTGGQYQNPAGGRLGEQQTESGSVDILFKPSDRLRMSLYGVYWVDDDGPQIDGIIGGPWSTVQPNAYNCNMGLVPAGQLNGVCGQLPGLNYVSLNKDVTALQQPAIYSVLVNDEGVSNILRPGYIDHFGLQRHAQEMHGNLEYDLPDGYTFNWNFGANRQQLGTINDGIQEPEPDPFFLYNGYYAEDNPLVNTDYSTEARITSPRSSPLKWLFGVNYVYETSKSADVAWFEGPFNYGVPEKETARTVGYFGSIEYDFPHGLRLTAESRYQQDTVGNELILLGTGSAQKTFDAFTPRIILSKRITDTSNAYVSYAVGNKPGTFNLDLLPLTPSQLSTVEAQTMGQLAVPEEKIYMYELGFKGSFFDNRARILADIYYGQWKNQQITQTGLYPVTLSSGGTGTISIPVTAAIGLTDIDGLELQGEFRLSDDLLLQSSFDLNNTDIRRYVCANCAVYETGSTDVSGHQLGHVPKYKATTSLTYYHSLWSDFQGFVRVEDQYRSLIYADETNLTWIGSSNIVNLHLGLQNDRYYAQLYATNIFNNTQYQSVAWVGSFLAPSVATINAWDVAPAEKPTVGVELSANF